MATLTSFTRPSDPIDVSALATKILNDTGLSVSPDITIADISLTGTISEANRTALQTSISSYYYQGMQTGVFTSDNPDMSLARHNVAVTEYASYTSDSAITAKQRGAYVNGVFVAGITPYILTGNTNSSGVVTLYATSDGTATGTAIFSTIPAGGITATPIGSASNYQVTGITVSTDKKTVTVTVNQLGSAVLGLVQITSAASGVPVSVIVWGK